jgi:hypothetical protein
VLVSFRPMLPTTTPAVCASHSLLTSLISSTPSARAGAGLAATTALVRASSMPINQRTGHRKTNPGLAAVYAVVRGQKPNTKHHESPLMSDQINLSRQSQYPASRVPRPGARRDAFQFDGVSGRELVAVLYERTEEVQALEDGRKDRLAATEATGRLPRWHSTEARDIFANLNSARLHLHNWSGN